MICALHQILLSLSSRGGSIWLVCSCHSVLTLHCWIPAVLGTVGVLLCLISCSYCLIVLMLIVTVGGICS